MQRFRSIMVAAGIVALAASCSSAGLDVEARTAAPDEEVTTASYLTLDETFGEWVGGQYAAVVYVHAWDVAHGAEYAAAVARAEAVARAVAPSRSSGPRRASGNCGGNFDGCFKECTQGHESGGNYAAVSPGGRYRGAYQFDQQTWNGAAARSGHPEWSGGDPAAAPPGVQDDAARQLYSERGNQPWGGRC